MTNNYPLHRHQLDPNLKVYGGREYNGMPIVWQQGPFIYNYLQRIDQAIQAALQDHSSLMAIRVDLRLPTQFYETNPLLKRSVFSKFIDSLRAKIKNRCTETERGGIRFHRTKVHYVWTREFGQNGNPHYHCALFFNKQTFLGLGEFNPHSQSLYGMISSAWASALGMEGYLTDGLVSIPKNAVYKVRRDERYDDLFYRVSYFAKLATKQFGLASHNFGTSRAPHS
jgi:hypothetical protein